MLHHPAPPQEEEPGEVAAVVLNPERPPRQLGPGPAVDVPRYHLRAPGRLVRRPRDDAAGPEVIVALAQHLLVAWWLMAHSVLSASRPSRVRRQCRTRKSCSSTIAKSHSSMSS